MGATLLIADDDLTIRTVLGKALSRQGFKVRTTAHAATLWHWASQGEGDLIITDVMMPDGNGLELVPSLQRLRPEVKIIVISAQNSLSTAVKTQELGVFGYLPKPFDLKQLIGLVESALSVDDKVKAKDEDDTPAYASDFPLVGKSSVMNEVFRKMGKFATSTAPVLIYGDVGVGKTLAAKTLLRSSSFFEEQIFSVNASSFDSWFDEKTDRASLLFLEGVEKLNPDQQIKLNTILDRLDGKPFKIISTSNLTPSALVKLAGIDKSLVDKLSELRLSLPTLSRRTEDIPALIDSFQKNIGSNIVFDPAVLSFLKQQPWTGNVQQLKNLVTQISTASDQTKLSVSLVEETMVELEQGTENNTWIKGGDINSLIKAWVESQSTETNSDGGLHKKLMQTMEKPLISEILKSTRNNQIKTAEILGLNRNTLRKKIKELGVEVGK